MKKWLFSLLAVLLLSIAFLNMETKAAQNKTAVRTVVEETYLLSEDYVTPITALPPKAIVLLHNVKAGWAHIEYKGQQGYVPSTTLKSAQAKLMLVSSKNPPIVRESTVAQAKHLGNLYVNSIVHVYATNEENWYFVQYGNLTGYVIATALKTPTTKKMLVQRPDGLVVRDVASKSGENLSVIPANTKVDVYTDFQGWAYVVSAQQVEGYVLAHGLKEIPMPKLGKYSQGVATKTKRIALTFDDGPHPTVTKQILATLEKYDAKATFFVTGHRVNKSPKVLKEIYDAGHEIGNHTWNHPKLTQISLNQVNAQINETNTIVKSIIGEEPTLFRPPYGAYNKEILSSLSVPLVTWSVDTLDWQHHMPAKTLKAIQNGSYNGSIILMHDIHQTTADALDSVLSYLSKQGYEFVTVSEIITQ
ncbi:polysaccharide deacetylase family protein [Metasolibacillus sp.]|uniref:polysaccharide deacetylase family protein n=1 Tax=Metasolibacillus sp. TaxID=2703680 RepID=UPI0025D18E7A|nr:polysaccharide deacetylase family protein [Metasolibacillus sp.]MCT6924673.1 polysaccharide deacetylase family protein [Metasolibacillus sp.]MCT6940875.1 polysaccharide deacetylase family protein [Metasolibacillus sp.]